MLDELLKQIFSSQWRVILIVGALLFSVSEWGFHRGLVLHDKHDDACKSQIGTLQGAVLGLLGLLLGFTFAMAVQRYDIRRDLVVQEANAIGTTFLRASFLPESHRAEVESLLRRYVDLRLQFLSAKIKQGEIDAVEKADAEIQQALWRHAVAAGRESNTPLVMGFVTALNDTIDLDATRLAAMRNHVPGMVWLLLLLVSASGCWISGYAAGSTGRRTTLSQSLMPALIAIVFTLLVDFDATRRGFIGVSQQSLVELRQSLSQP